MKRKVVCFASLIFMIFAVASNPVSAVTLNLPAFYSGWYNIAGFHDPGNTNYFVGDGRGVASYSLLADYRNFFVFDLANVMLPIESGVLALEMPLAPSPPPPSYGYASSDPSETYELHDVTTSIDKLVNGTGGITAHADLGDGSVYGSRIFTAADNGKVIEIQLSALAIADMNITHSRFAIGGKLTTLDDLPNLEAIFSVTGGPNEIRELRLTLIPEPTSLTLLSITAVMLSGSRFRKRQV